MTTLPMEITAPRNPLGNTRRQVRFWTSNSVPAICQRPGNAAVIDIYHHLTGAPLRTVQDWFRGMEAVGRRARSKPPTDSQMHDFLYRLGYHIRTDDRVDTTALLGLLDTAATHAAERRPTGPEWLAWRTTREKIDKYAYDRFTAHAEYLRVGDLVRLPGRDIDSGGLAVAQLHTTPRGKIIITGANRITMSIDRHTPVRIARPDPTFGAPSLAVRDRHGGLMRGLYGCGYQTPPGGCGGKCGRPHCLMATDLLLRSLHAPTEQ